MRAPEHIVRSPLSALLLVAIALLSLESSLALAEGDLPASEATADVVSADRTDEDVLTSEAVPPEEGFVDRAARAFTESDLVFARGFSNAPFLPVAFLGNTHYGLSLIHI